MEVLRGSVNAVGSVAYVSQQAWIQNMSVKDNILFNNKLTDSVPPGLKSPTLRPIVSRYNKVLEACSLKSDLEILSNGDQTEIGENGINLSGVY